MSERQVDLEILRYNPAFVAMRPISELTEEEIETVTGLLHARRESKGVPLIWDVVVVEADPVPEHPRG